jgi:hypothetical protein
MNQHYDVDIENTRRVAVFLLSGLSAESKKNITLCALCASSEAGSEKNSYGGNQWRV